MDLAGADRSLAGIAPEARLGYDRLACFDPATGEKIGDYTAISQALEAAARARADAETHAAEIEARVQAEVKACARAEARIQALEAELKRLGNGPPGD